jgi:hypothetical protein
LIANFKEDKGIALTDEPLEFLFVFKNPQTAYGISLLKTIKKWKFTKMKAEKNPRQWRNLFDQLKKTRLMITYEFRQPVGT